VSCLVEPTGETIPRRFGGSDPTTSRLTRDVWVAGVHSFKEDEGDQYTPPPAHALQSLAEPAFGENVYRYGRRIGMISAPTSARSMSSRVVSITRFEIV
jgi:hypothetical protein